MSTTETIPFGLLLRQLRTRAGMTQRDLAAALDYSDTLICNLEKGKRLPDLDAVVTHFVPALGLQDDAASARRLIERAASARGERLPESLRDPVAFSHTQHVMAERPEINPPRLPSAPAELIGRTDEVERLCNRLLGHGGRLLTLMGPPGIGKTSLALAVAAHLQHHYHDGAVFVALAEIIDPVLVASTILAAIGSSDSSAKTPKVKVIENLRRKSMLLVLDNCEQIQDAAPLVADVLAECGGITILATSRERLHLRAEQRHHVPPLEVGPAVELFVQRAAAVDSRFALTVANRPTVEAICERLDRLPLALELYAAQTDLLSLPQLLAQLQDRRLDLLVDGAHDLPARQRTLHRAIQSSYALLSEEEAALFRSLGVFVGGFDLEAVAMVGAASLTAGIPGESPALPRTLHALIGKSLVRVEMTPRGEQRFLLLETLREFALKQLREHGEQAEMRLRHYLIYLQLFRTGDSHLRGPEAAIWMARLQAERDNLRAALQWTFDEARYTDMAWLLIAGGYFWYLEGRRHEETTWIARLLPYRQMLTIALRLAILSDFYMPARQVEGFSLRKPDIGEIFDLLEICPYKQLHAATWHFLAFTSSDPAQATISLARVVQLLREAGEGGPTLGAEFCVYADTDYCLASFQWAFGGFLLDQGEFARATSLITDSLQRFRKRGNQPCIGNCLGTLGILALMRGNIAEAHSFFHEVVTIGKTHSVLTALAYWQPLLGLATLYGGNSAEARRLIEEGVHLSHETKNSECLSRACMCMAEISLWEGDTGQAELWLGQSLTYQTSPLPNTLDELQWLFVAARLATNQGQYWRAAALLGLAEAEHSRIHYVYAGPMLPLVNAAYTTVRAELGAALFDEAFAAGQQLSYAEAYAVEQPAILAKP